MKKNTRAARAARTLEQLRATLCKTTTWKYHLYGVDDNVRKDSKSWTLCVYFNGAPCVPAVAYFADIGEFEQNRKRDVSSADWWSQTRKKLSLFFTCEIVFLRNGNPYQAFQFIK